jgi:hypothetical protein
MSVIRHPQNPVDLQIKTVSMQDIEVTECRIQELREVVRTDHLNDKE